MNNQENSIKKIFSLNTIKNRENNLKHILPVILKQSDKIYVNLIGYNKVPDILNHEKIVVNEFDEGGSELRFYNYNDKIFENDAVYYFTIDDDILYPIDYSDVLIEKMIKYENNSVCCVHGSLIDFKIENNYYKNRRIFNFKNKIKNDITVHLPGVGTSCFYKEKVKINLNNFKTRNMSDPYIGAFLYKQNITSICVSREKNWLRDLNPYGTTIFGNNPYDEIDKLFNEVFKKNK